MVGARRLRAAAVVLAVAAVVQGVPAHLVWSAAPPSLRLRAASRVITVEAFPGEPLWLDLGVWVESVDGAFELRVARPRYDEPVAIDQVDASTGAVLRTLPNTLLDGWSGLRRFLEVTIRDADGRVVSDGRSTFCPNAWDRNRVDDEGPAVSRYPSQCSSHPLTKGMVWGIDQGWAVNGSGFGRPVNLPPGRYEATVAVTRPYRERLGISGPSGRATVIVRVVRAPRGRSAGSEEDGARTTASEEEPHSRAAVPVTTNPDPATLPDLGSLPAFGFSLFRQDERERLAFAATEWNRGPAPLVVEGFRRQRSNVMDAYQYFYDGDTAVGKAPVGTFEYHAGRGHDHWHFLQFARYDLLDRTRQQVVRSRKSSWCLIPTDAIDLTVPGADLTADTLGLHTACGHQGSLWVREVLQVGWGDTYFQGFGGQSFDITGLPNGTYFVRVLVNPGGALYERTQANNTSLRRIRIVGPAGNRRVEVPSWHGIDTEAAYGWGF